MRRPSAISLLALVLAALGCGRGVAQTTLAADPAFSELWVASRWARGLAVVDLRTETLRAEIPLASEVRSLVLEPTGGRVFAAEADRGTIAVVDRATHTLLGRIHLGGDPSHLALTPNGTRLVALSPFHRVVTVLDLRTLQTLLRIENPRGLFDGEMHGLVVSDDGDGDDTDETIWVAELSARGSQIDLQQGYGAVLQLPRVTALRVSDGSVQYSSELGIDPDPWVGGVPTNLRGLALEPGGGALWVLGENANTLRGVRSRGPGAPAPHPDDDRVFVRPDGRFNGPGVAVGTPPIQAMIRRVDTANGQEIASRRVVLSDDRPTVARTPVGGPCHAAWHPAGGQVYVVDQVSGDLLVLEAGTDRELATLSLGFQPRTLLFGPSGKAYVHLDLEFGVAVLDVSNPVAPARTAFVPTTTRIPLSPTDLHGLRLFSHGYVPALLPESRKISGAPQMACVSCHPDGHTNGLVWDQSELQRGPRSTQSLLDWRSSARLGWDGFRDEMQDFVNAAAKVEAGAWNHAFDPTLPDAVNDPAWNVRSNVGADPDLDAVAGALDRVFGRRRPAPAPARLADGLLSAAAQRGYEHFVSNGCAECHPPSLHFTDSGVPYDGINFAIPLHPGVNPDTFKWEPGTLHVLDAVGPPAQYNPNINRVAGFDAPSLRHLQARATFFHDGHVLDLAEVIATLGQTDDDAHAGPGFLGHPATSAAAADLEAFLLSLDDREVPYAGATEHAVLGSTWQYALRGTPLAVPVVLVALGTAEQTLPGLGTLLLDPGSTVVYLDGFTTNTALGPAGSLDLYVRIPLDHALVGGQVVFQSLLFDPATRRSLGATNTRPLTIR